MVMHRIGSATPQGIGCSSHLLSANLNGVFVYRLVREIVDLLGAVRLRYTPPFCRVGGTAIHIEFKPRRLALGGWNPSLGTNAT